MKIGRRVVATVNMMGSKGNAVTEVLPETMFTLNAMHGHDVHAVLIEEFVMNVETNELMFWSAEHLARHSALPDCERDWQTLVATSRLPILPLLHSIGPSGWSGRTSPASCRIVQGRLEPCSEGWGNSGMGSPTGFLTLNTCEWTAIRGRCRSDAGVCSLSDVLETGDVPQRYYLSARACAGILRRAGNRGKELPPTLHRALEQVARDSSEPEKHEDKTR